MTQRIKKSASQRNTNHKKLPPFKGLEAVQRTEQKVLQMEREGLENVMQATQAMNNAASECAAACSDNIFAYIDSGNKAAHAIQHMSSEVMGYCNRAFSSMAEISQDAVSCRSLGDVVELHNSAIQQLSDNYFTTVNKLSSMGFELFSQTMKPFGERAASVTKHLRRALAA